MAESLTERVDEILRQVGGYEFLSEWRTANEVRKYIYLHKKTPLSFWVYTDPLRNALVGLAEGGILETRWQGPGYRRYFRRKDDDS